MPNDGCGNGVESTVVRAAPSLERTTAESLARRRGSIATDFGRMLHSPMAVLTILLVTPPIRGGPATSYGPR
jgi:hypothetical protein